MPPEIEALIAGSRDAVRRVIVDLRDKAAGAEQLRAAEHRAALAAHQAFMAEQREAIAALTRRMEERLATIRHGADGRDGQDGRDAVDGKSVDMEEVRAFLASEVEKAVAALPNPSDGVEGRPGRDGNSVTMVDVEPLILAAIERAVAGLPVPKDGTDGRDGVSLAGAMIDRSGHLVVTLSSGELRALGPVVGRDGADGAPGQSITGAPGRDGTSVTIADVEPVIVEQVARAVATIPVPKDGRDGRDGADAYPGEARGLFDPDGTYRALDVVSFNGAEWRAKRDDPGALPGEGWMLSASRGKRGDRGDRGERGLPGADGATIAAAYFDKAAFEMILTRDDGEEMKVDLTDLAHVIRAAI